MAAPLVSFFLFKLRERRMHLWTEGEKAAAEDGEEGVGCLSVCKLNYFISLIQ